MNRMPPWLTTTRRSVPTSVLPLKPCRTDLLLDWPNCHFTNPHRPYPDDPPSDHLFVVLHSAPEGREGYPRDLVGQPSKPHQAPDSFDNLRPTQAHVTGQFR